MIGSSSQIVIRKINSPGLPQRNVEHFMLSSSGSPAFRISTLIELVTLFRLPSAHDNREGKVLIAVRVATTHHIARNHRMGGMDDCTSL